MVMMHSNGRGGSGSKSDRDGGVNDSDSGGSGGMEQQNWQRWQQKASTVSGSCERIWCNNQLMMVKQGHGNDIEQHQ